MHQRNQRIHSRQGLFEISLMHHEPSGLICLESKTTQNPFQDLSLNFSKETHPLREFSLLVILLY